MIADGQSENNSIYIIAETSPFEDKLIAVENQRISAQQRKLKGKRKSCQLVCVGKFVFTWFCNIHSTP